MSNKQASRNAAIGRNAAARIFLAAFVMLTAASVAAETQKVYKIVQLDGRVVYTDVMQDVKVAAVRELPPVPGKNGVQLVAPELVEEVNNRAKNRSEYLEQRFQHSLKADEKLREAEKTKEEGIEPLAGERTGIKGKFGLKTRLNDTYYERQQKLDDELEKARQEAGEASRNFRLMQ